ncbi:MAG: lipoprotein insertase outer membrane protein LolB [Pseudomonadota bacterium]
MIAVCLISRSRSAMSFVVLCAAFLVAGCATPQKPAGSNAGQNDEWAGRISLQIQSEPPQAFFAGFELRGRAEAGELKLTSPIGSVLGVMRWSPSEAVLESGRDVKKFASVDALLEQTTGAAIPVNALFDWLNGKNTSLNGWTADLSQQSAGKISATRTNPAPQTDLRVVLDQ